MLMLLATFATVAAGALGRLAALAALPGVGATQMATTCRGVWGDVGAAIRAEGAGDASKVGKG